MTVEFYNLIKPTAIPQKAEMFNNFKYIDIEYDNIAVILDDSFYFLLSNKKLSKCFQADVQCRIIFVNNQLKLH